MLLLGLLIKLKLGLLLKLELGLRLTLLLMLFAGSTNTWHCLKMATSEGSADAGAEKVGFL